MKTLTGKLALAFLMTGALAMPASAAPPNRASGGHPAAAARMGGGAPHGGGGAPHGGGGTPHFGGGGRAAFHAPAARSFTPHAAARSFAPHVSARSFAPHVSARSFTPRTRSRSFAPHAHTRSFTPHVGTRSLTRHGNGRSNFANIHRGTTFNRSVRRGQWLRHGNIVNRNIRNNSRNIRNNSNALRSNANANLRNRAFHHRNATGSITPLAARNGRFASRFASHSQGVRSAFAARRAWRHHRRADFVPWYGPVFWPYAYSDIFDYAFWPGGYDDGFWDYAYDDFVDGLFWGQSGPPEDYAYAGPAPAPTRVTHAGVRELCTQPGTGITAWPFADIERKVGLNGDQKALLNDVRKAAADAAATFKASCPTENAFPLTPPGRLTAMTARLQGTLDAVKVVRPALEKFYASLSDEQKERFNALGPKRTANNAEASAALPQNAKSCEESKPGLSTLPIEKIADVVKPTNDQQAGLKKLQDATTKAVSVLQAACPEDVPLTPPGRLAAMETRLTAMVEAAKTVKPALESFYASLNSEQKARFDRIGQELAQNNG